MPKDITTLPPDKLLEEIPNTNETWFIENMTLFAGDHWMNAAGWVGPQLDKKDPGASQMMEDIKRAFVSKNVVREIVSRHVAGVLGNDPIWKVTSDMLENADPPEDPPEGGEPEEITPSPLEVEAEEIIRAWWDGSQGLVAGEEALSSPLTVIKSAIERALLTDRGPLRLFIPSKFLTEVSTEATDEKGAARETAVIETSEPGETLKKIFLLGPAADHATVGLDNNAMTQYGIYLIDADDPDTAEIEGVGHTGEIVFVDEDEMTHIRIIEADYDPKGEFDEIKIEMGGKLTMFEIQVPRLVSDSVRQLQKQLNMILTMMGRNVVQAGFLERILLNAQLPGVTQLNEVTGEEDFIPDDLELGPGATAFIQGVTYQDADGDEHIADPKVVYRNPVETKTFIESREEIYRQILEEAKQSHILTVGEANLSGKSRMESRFDYEASLEDTQHEVEQALTWVFETVLKMVGIFSGTPDMFNSLNVSVQTELNLGRPGPDEVKMVIDKVDAKLQSRRAGMSELGTKDVETEEAQIEKEQLKSTQDRFTSLASAIQETRGKFDAGNPDLDEEGDE